MGGVASWFAERGEIPLALPPGLREYAPLSDDPNRPPGASSSRLIRGVAFGMEYCDARGWASTRAVRCLTLDPEGPVHLEAFCHLRDSVRSFRLDRIISVFDLRTGAILSGEAHSSLFASYLPGGDDEVAALRRLQNATRSGVFALLHLAMSDGRLSGEAREIVLDYLAVEAGAVDCPLPAGAAVELWVDNLAPPLDAVSEAVEDLLGEQHKFVRVLPWLLKVVRNKNGPAEDDSIRRLIEEVRGHFKRKLAEPTTHFRATR